ncbi:MAG: hypothetical protein AAFQ32_04630 [Pseudomonadota bacterium]
MSETLMSQMHDELTKALLKRIKEGSATASDLSVARQFLKDNGIQVTDANDEGMKSLTDELPDDIDFGDNVTPIYGG